MTPAANSLSGLAILVLEDDYHLAEELCLGLSEAGAKVLGPAPSVADGMKLLEAYPLPDAAVMDVKHGLLFCKK